MQKHLAVTVLAVLLCVSAFIVRDPSAAAQILDSAAEAIAQPAEPETEAAVEKSIPESNQSDSAEGNSPAEAGPDAAEAAETADAAEAANTADAEEAAETNEQAEDASRRSKEDVVVTEYKSEESEAFLWDCLNEYTGSEYLTAGIMGYFWRESFFRSDATAGWTDNPVYNAHNGDNNPEEFTRRIDAGLADGSTRQAFIDEVSRDLGGYGLGQWQSPDYVGALYDFAREWGSSIGDAEMQCAFTVGHIRENEELWQKLCSTDDPYKAGLYIGVLYDGTTTGYQYIAASSKILFDRYTEK